MRREDIHWAFFDGSEPGPLIPDDDVMCFLARPEIQRGVRLTHYGLIKTRRPSGASK
ncbi:hypothetical protein BGY98DRAFT_1024286 [Russula aff. rugulosa BPL654]|nr:hypothetical protein BGY98DRAFT_1024286 [Russula aff. rugulosa BPL654]